MNIFLPGGAGLVGLNLIEYLRERHPSWEILVVDKKKSSIDIARKLFPEVHFICEDLTKTRGQKWKKSIKNYEACVMLQAEIGNKDITKFHKNNVLSTKVIMKELKKNNYKRLIHISSSVVDSIAQDEYTKTKRKQEKIIEKNWEGALILSPTLMFGWFDRKHLGWLAKFMSKFLFFPIPGSGNFVRQPLYVRDFCKLIESGLINKNLKGKYEITGLEKVPYKLLMKKIKLSVRAKTIFINIPIPLFGFLLQIWSLLSGNPAFTKSQLKALTAGDEFKVIDWPKIFNKEPTILKEALDETFNHPKYSKIKFPF